MILLSGGTKARHRGAGLIRNLLFSPRTREAVAQVDKREQVCFCVCCCHDPDLMYTYCMSTGSWNDESPAEAAEIHGQRDPAACVSRA